MTQGSANNSGSDLKRENEKFDRYYKDQNIVPENEWEAFKMSITSDLPITFRIVTNTVHTQQLKSKTDEIVEKFPDLCQPVKWLHHNLAYQLNVSRSQLRSEPQLKEFHQMIVREAEAGTLFRQEAVSMIPVSLLDVQPHHVILDMCSAPGSKTSQIIERMHTLWASDPASEITAYPPGVCVANELSPKRAHMLIHHISALNSPSLVVQTRCAQLLPNMFYADTGARIQYDRVLADVPCSGDGTLRKAPALWQKWNAGCGAGLHKLQLQIAKRGAHLLKVGGRMVYSTCSLNPIENESVVAALIREAGGCLKVVDASGDLEGLAKYSGLLKWKAGWGEEFFDSYEEVPKKLQKKIQPTFFPPKGEEEAKKLGLDKCMRMIPHLSNTGGFFVAVLEKSGALPWETPLTSRMAAKRSRKEDESTEKVAENPLAAEQTCMDDESAEIADVEELAAEEAELEASGDLQVLAQQQSEGAIGGGRQADLEQEESKIQVFKQRTRCVDFESLKEVNPTIASQLWNAAALPLGLDKLFGDAKDFNMDDKSIGFQLLVRTSAAEARHRQMELRKELMKRERACKMGHSKKSAVSTENEANMSSEGASLLDVKNSDGVSNAAIKRSEPSSLTEAAEGEGRGVPEVPRKVWLVSREAARILASKGRAPYKVLHAGVCIFEKNRASKDLANYRPSMALSKWLMKPILTSILEAAVEQDNVNVAAMKESLKKKGLQGNITIVPPELFVKLLATQANPPRVSRGELPEEKLEFLDLLEKERCSVMVVKDVHLGVMSVPLWVGRNNFEVLIDMTTKKSLEWAFNKQ